MSKKTDRHVIARLEDLYARLPRVNCKQLCGGTCGPILLTDLEADRLRRADPQRRAIRVVGDGARARCVYLSPRERCAVYAVRPLICRVYGAVRRLSCYHGCTPDRWLTDREFLEIAKAIERLAGAMGYSHEGGFAELPPTDRFSNMPAPPPEDERAIEHFAERTRNLRALFGGLVVGVVPRAEDAPATIRVEPLRPSREDE